MSLTSNLIGVGPCLGSVAATGFYKLLLLLEYKTANPGQDHDGLHHGYPTGSGFEHAHASSSVVGGTLSRDEIQATGGSEIV